MENIKTVKELLEYACDNYGDKAYIKYNTKDGIVEKSFLQIRKDSYAIGRFLKNAFGTEGKRVAILGNASYEYTACYFGVVCSGNVVVQVDINVAPDKLSNILESAGVDVVFYEKKLSQRALYLKRKCSTINLFVCFDNDESDMNSLKSHIRYNVGNLETILDANEVCVIAKEITSDGKSFEKKLTNKVIIDNILKQQFRMTGNDTVLCLRPIYIAECFNANVLLAMKEGATLCFGTSKVSMLEDIKRYKPTKIEVDSVIASNLLGLLKKNEIQKESFKNIYCVNEWINPSIAKEYEKYGIETDNMDKIDFIKE